MCNVHKILSVVYLVVLQIVNGFSKVKKALSVDLTNEHW